MDTSPTEASPVQSTRGFKGVLAKARRGGKDTAPSPSFFNGTDNSSDSHGIRSSVESLQALEKDRASRESSIDDGTTTTKSRTLAKLIPARIKKKLKRQGSLEREEEQGEDGEEREHMDGHGNAIMDPAPASTSTAVGSSRQNTTGGDSLMSYDSDETES